MKRLKKLLLIMMCVGILVSVTACAGNSNDNGAGQNDVVNDNGANDTQTGDSAMDKIGDGLEDGIDDVGLRDDETHAVLGSAAVDGLRLPDVRVAPACVDTGDNLHGIAVFYILTHCRFPP